MQEKPEQTTDRENIWKIWHSCNYIIGGLSYLIGSVLLFPFFGSNPNAAQLSGWIYTIGSFTFLLADITQWWHYVQLDCRYWNFVINFFINIMGSFLYLVGSICFIPQINKSDWGLNIFIVASFFIILAQLWKIIRTFSQSSKSFSQIFKENQSGILIDFFAGAGALMYFSGSFVFKKAGQIVNLLNISALIYSLGGFFFLLSGIFILQRYFCEHSNQSEPIKQEELND